jgi:hypothetical protein
VVGVEMPLAGVLRAAQLVQHHIRRRCIDAGEATVSHHVRLPPTLSATPLVSLEAKHTQAFVLFIVAAFDPDAALLVRESLRSGSD